ncbi:MAG: hypothetical protein PHR94_02255 [Methylomonas lenta]|nr:hypothetical protein [Methylomonas lenta]
MDNSTITSEMKHKASSKVKSILIASSLAIGFAAQPAQAALTFTFNYLNPGQGFDDPTLGADRKAALNDSANALGAYFTNYTANLVYDVTSYSTDNSTLASAGSSMYIEPGTFQQTHVQAKILGNGTDANGAAADGEINWNFFFDWGLGDNVSANQYDFKSTAIHELLHSFGFASNVSNGGLGLEDLQPGNPETWSIFDDFLTDAAGNRLISTDGVFDPNKVAALTAGTTNAAGVLFSGANALAANNGAGIPIFSPNPYVDGSSVSHLDDNSTVSNTSIMNANAHNQGLDMRTLGALEMAVLKDIGYTQIAAPVPVPASIWFMLTGMLGLLGFNRRKTAA